MKLSGTAVLLFVFCPLSFIRGYEWMNSENVRQFLKDLDNEVVANGLWLN